MIYPFFYIVHGLTFLKENGRQFKILILPSKVFSKAYLETLMEDFKSLGYPVSFEERDGRYVLKVTDKIVILGE
ncbi:conserved lipothrixviral protein [Sulfolobus islandicus filamentous virus 2]|uniref:Conserved lipothrixviral protein n=1 Tax=Sulfolobus islandicus filamentous virus 2 TaxID=1902331 RepID=A0A1D8BJC9_SIFV|nr:conserved lipothrixviral protein [Sulfolobus islandicus filamentous virus 2]